MLTGRKLHQMMMSAPAPAPAMLAPASAPISMPTPVLPVMPVAAACVSIASLLPTTFASLGSVSPQARAIAQYPALSLDALVGSLLVRLVRLSLLTMPQSPGRVVEKEEENITSWDNGGSNNCVFAVPGAD